MERELALSMFRDLRDRYLPNSNVRHGGRCYPEADVQQYNEIVRSCGLPFDRLLPLNLLKPRMVSKNLLEPGREVFSKDLWIDSQILGDKLDETISLLKRS